MTCSLHTAPCRKTASHFRPLTRTAPLPLWTRTISSCNCFRSRHRSRSLAMLPNLPPSAAGSTTGRPESSLAILGASRFAPCCHCLTWTRPVLRRSAPWTSWVPLGSSWRATRVGSIWETQRSTRSLRRSTSVASSPSFTRTGPNRYAKGSSPQVLCPSTSFWPIPRAPCST